MMWPFAKPKRKSDAEIEEEQRRSDRARREMEIVHRRLDAAVQKMIVQPKQSEVGK
jgi:hypothetical protein